MRLNKFLFLFLSVLFLFILSACSSNKSNKIKVVATVYPEYDWAKQIIGDSENIELTLLVKNGVDFHSYEPSTNDIITIGSSDLFIYIGGESDKWVEKVLKQSPKQPRTINLMSSLKNRVVEEETVEGMQEESEEHEEGLELDEHVWLSLENASFISKEIASALKELDSSNAEKYQANCDSYVAQLSDIKNKYKKIFAEKNNPSIIVCDRFPFRYLTDEFQIKYHAAFKGCSAETEANFDTIRFLSEKVKNSQTKTVFKIEGSSDKLCRSIISNAGASDCSIVALDSMQSTTLEQAENGTTYLNTMDSTLSKIAGSLE